MMRRDDRSWALHGIRTPGSEDAGLLEFLPAAAFVASRPGGRILYANTQWRHLVQGGYATLGALSAQRLRRADGRAHAARASPLERALRTGRGLDDAEVDVVEPDGGLGLWSVSARPLPAGGSRRQPHLLVTVQPRPRRYSRRFVHTAEVARRLLSDRSLSLEAVLAAALRATCLRLRWHFGAVYVAEQGSLRQIAGWAQGGDRPPSLLRAARSALGSATGVWSTVADASTRGTLLAMPVRLGRQAIGVAVWGTWHERPRDDTMMATMDGVTDEVAVAVARHRSLDHLYRTESRLHSLVRFSPVPIVAVSRDRTVEVWNPAAEKVYGWTVEEVIGRPLPFLPPGDADSPPILEGLWRGVAFPSIPGRRVCRDGRVLQVSISAAPTFDAEGRVDGAVTVDLDVSDRTRFLQVAGHELRNPLATAKGLLGLARGRLEAGGPVEVVAGHLRTAEGQIDRTALLLGEILQGFRVAAGQTELSLRVVELADAVTRAVRAAIEDGEAAPGRLRVAVPSHGNVLVLGDDARLVQAVRAVLSNAFKFSPEGGPVRVHVSADDAYATIVVEDQGIGVPRDEVEEVFQPFARGSNLADRDPGGLGLGLYLCRDIVTRHGGRVWLTPRRPTGARLQIRLRRHAGDVPG